MRIVGGQWRGRTFEAPEGRGTRPTTDRMRESIASMVMSACRLDLAGARVLDAFAGSGAVGLELLSRGAAHGTFVERDRRAAGVVRRNCRALVEERARFDVVVGDVCARAQAGSLVGGPFSVVFLDPPYAMPAAEVSALVLSLAEHDLLEDGCLVVYERAEGSDTLAVAGLEGLRSRSHGSTSTDLYRWTSTNSKE